MRVCPSGHQNADPPRPLALLRVRRERPRSRRADQRHELATPHSITPSASASRHRRHADTKRLSVFRLIALNFRSVLA
jgi:hypothetical protein